MKSKNKKILNLLLLGILFSTFLFHFDNNNVNYAKNIDDNDVSENANIDNLKSQSINQDNSYSGIGEPWNLTHYANRTDYGESISFNNGSSDTASVPLGSGWEGYKLQSDIYNLHDTQNWNNGTFDFGPMGEYNPGDNDDYLTSNNPYQNWTFTAEDVTDERGYVNEMSGNYLNESYDQDTEERSSLELRMDANSNSSVNAGYSKGDKCYWNSSFKVPRGKVIDSQLTFDANPMHLADFNSWELAFSINGMKSYSIGTYSLKEYGEGLWHSFSIPLGLWSNTSSVYPSILNDSMIDIQFSLEYIAASADYGSDFENVDYQQILIDNVELEITSEVKPSQIGLEINEEKINDVDWGEGKIELEGNWQDDQVISNFSCGDTWELSTFQIDFQTDINLFALKKTPETNFNTDTASLGTNFEIVNNSGGIWDFFVYFSVPTSYEEDEMILEFPTDVNITWVSEPQDPSQNRLINCDNSTEGKLIVDVDTISTTPDGFWSFEAKSPNYLNLASIYNNQSGEWIQDNEFLSGEFINITAEIDNTQQVNGYLEQTKAKLSIRFPNGTIWREQSQYSSPNSNGFVKFDPFQIPTEPPDYEVGEYEAIITWNNSYSNFGINETGVITKTFTVIHDSVLTADTEYFEDILEDSLINLKVSFNDIESNDAIQNAEVYTRNFTDPNKNHYFSEISPGFYLYEFNVSGAEAGNNTITVYANSSQYINQEINITVSVIKETSFEADRTLLSVYWNENFTVQLNYTESNSGIGIDTNPTHNWNGDAHIKQVSLGVYNLTCNSSLYQVNQLHSLIVEVDEFGYESQSLLIKVDIKERPISLNDLELNQSAQDSISIPHNEKLNITINCTDQLSNKFVDNANINLKKQSEILGSFSKLDGSDLYNLSINTRILSLGINSLTIEANKNNYSSASIGLTVSVLERETYYHQLWLNGTDKTSSKSITIPWNESLPVGVVINDSLSDQFISGIDNLKLTGPNISVDLNEDSGLYSGTIAAGKLGVGTTSLTIDGSLENYTISSLDITVIVTDRDTYYHQLWLNGTDKTGDESITIPWNESLTVGVVLNDSLSDQFISRIDNLKLTGSNISVDLNEDSGLYSGTIAAGKLSVGSTTLTISGSLENYTIDSLPIAVTVTNRETSISEIFIDGEQRENIEIPWNESLSVAIFYNDTALNKLIEGADVTLTGTGIDKELERDGDYYNVTIEAGALEVGTSLLTIAAKKTNYSSEYTTITVTVKSRETDFTRLDLNEENKIEEESITLFWNETLSVGVVINDSSTNHFVQGVDFHLTGTDISVVLSEEGGIYTGSIEAGELPVGTTRLTLEGSLNNYSIEDLRITVNVNERETFLGYEEPENVPYEDNVTLEVWFRDLELNSSINPATIRVSNSSDSEYWEPFSDYLVTFNDSEEKYIVEFNSTIFADEGAFPIYITANRTNYETAKERIFITIDARESDFILEVFDLEDKRYLDRTADPTLERDVNQTVDIRFNYTDISGKSLDGASVKIRIDETWENLTYNDTAGYHNISFSAGPNTLDRTFNTLPIRAEKNGYESQEIILEVQIIERKTNITLYINGDDKTDEPVVDFYYGQTFNISVNYTDYYTGEPISNPDIELLGDYIANLTYDEIQIDTTDLDIGMNFITVSASRDNYERKTISLVVQVQRIRGEIYIEDNIKTFKAEPGDDITITLELRDVYNDSISDATVTYTSNIINEDLRNGIFTQIDEGVYEVTLNEVPEGVYTLIISVTFEDPEKLRIYRVEDYDINLEVKRPEEEIFLLRALSIGGTIAAIGAIGYLIAYQKVLKYPKPVRKVRRFKKKLKKKKIDESEYQSRKSAFRESYRESIDPSISKKLGPKSKPKKK